MVEEARFGQPLAVSKVQRTLFSMDEFANCSTWSVFIPSGMIWTNEVSSSFVFSGFGWTVIESS